MPLVKVRTVLPANGTANPMAGSQYEYLPYAAYVEIGVVADAAGVLCTVSSGSDVLQEEAPLTVKAINVAPVYPDDYDLTDTAAPGDRLKVQLRDTSGVQRVIMTAVKITPL